MAAASADGVVDSSRGIQDEDINSTRSPLGALKNPKRNHIVFLMGLAGWLIPRGINMVKVARASQLLYRYSMPRLVEERVHNRPEKKNFRRKLRSELTPAEATMWKLLKNSRLEGRKFRRQPSVGKYIVDFYCPAERLAIELDGEVHSGGLAQIHDMVRRRYLIDNGIRILRFENRLVYEYTDHVLERIVAEFGWWKQKS